MNKESYFKYIIFNSCCPKCRQGKIFKNFLEIKEKCEFCKFKLSDHDCGDGPMFFATLILNIFIVSLAIITEIYFSPPLWAHIIIWSIIIILLSIILIKYLKLLFLVLHYKYRKK